MEAVAVRARGAVPAVGDGVAEGEDAEFGPWGDGCTGGVVREAGGEGVVWRVLVDGWFKVWVSW